jgi:hypothetical protein
VLVAAGDPNLSQRVAPDGTLRFVDSDHTYADFLTDAKLVPGDPLQVIEDAPEGFPPVDLPAEPDVFAPDYAPEEIAEIAKKLRVKAGLPEIPTGVVANDTNGVVDKVKEAIS